MKHNLHKAQLKKKGWTQKEIDHAENILKKAFEKNPVQFVDQLIYFGMLILGLAGVIVFALEIIPLLLLLEPLRMTIILLILSFSFGTLFGIVIEDIHWLSKKHHWLTISFLLITTIITFIIIINFSTRYGTPKMSGWLAGIIFGSGLTSPYFIHILTSSKYRKK